jgi:predicted RNA-binding Zn-ribbon protein involved in translation (DUF1610 family)
MKDKKCASCGTVYEGDEGWLTCPECGKAYCLRCTDKMRKEQQDIERLRNEDAFTRAQILCPSCSLVLIR